MLRRPTDNERLFVRNTSPASVTFAPTKLLVMQRGSGVWVDEHWSTFEEFRDDPAVMGLSSRNRILVEHRLIEE